MFEQIKDCIDNFEPFESRVWYSDFKWNIWKLILLHEFDFYDIFVEAGDLCSSENTMEI